MSPIRCTWVTVLSLLLGALLTSGCGSKMALLQGRVLNDGEAYQLAPNEDLVIVFFGGDPDGAYSALVNPDGTFEVRGVEGRGIPLGNYHITVASTPKGASPDKDRFKGRFSTREKTPLTVEITPNMKNLTIDVGKRTVAKDT